MPMVRIRANYDGHVTASAKTGSPATLKVGDDGGTAYRGFLRFPLTALGSTPDISRVELELSTWRTLDVYGRCDVHPYNNNGQGDPEVDNAATAYSRSSPNGTPYVDDTFLFRASGRHRILLGLGVGATACTDLEAAVAGGIFSLGIHEEGDDDQYCEIEGLAHAHDGPGELIVTYNETATAQALLTTLAQRVNRDHYESGTLTNGASAGSVIDTVQKQEDDYWISMWLLMTAGARAGEGRQVSDFANSTSTFTLAKAFSGAPGSNGYVLLPFPPELAARALNSAAADLFPDYLDGAMSVEVGTYYDRHQVYDIPAGMDRVDQVEFRAGGFDMAWRPATFRQHDEGRVSVTSGLPVPGVLRFRGRQRLSQIDESDPLTLAGTVEVTYPDAGMNAVTELLLLCAERKLHQWYFAEYDQAPAVGPGYVAANRKIAELDGRETVLKTVLRRYREYAIEQAIG